MADVKKNPERLRQRSSPSVPLRRRNNRYERAHPEGFGKDPEAGCGTPESAPRKNGRARA